MATSKGKRFKDLRYLQLFVKGPSAPASWTYVMQVIHTGLGWCGQSIHSHEHHTFAPDAIVYPVTLTCKLEGTE